MGGRIGEATGPRGLADPLLFLENAYKVLYRWYYTPAGLASFTPSYSPLCFRGCSQEGTMVEVPQGMQTLGQSLHTPS